jgi:hypothetical protein
MDTYQDQPFTKAFLDDHRPFTVLRFMDWNATNNNPQGMWSERRPKDWCSQTTAPTNPDNRGGVAYEWMIELCNTLQRDMWICVPHLADQNYQRNLAKLIRDNLDKNLKCYVEWSNEVWNWNFKQTGYAKNQGMNVKNFSGKAGEAVNMYYTYASVNLFRIFEEEFAGDRRYPSCDRGAGQPRGQSGRDRSRCLCYGALPEGQGIVAHCLGAAQRPS